MALCIKNCLRKLATLLTLGLYEHDPYHHKVSLFFPLVNEAFVSVKGNRLRAVLAMLGIVIGVGSVIVMLAIGHGSQKMIEESIMALGTNQLLVLPYPEDSAARQMMPAIQFENSDITAIAQLPYVANAVPSSQTRDFDMSVGSLKISTKVIASSPDYFAIKNWEFSEGDSFSTADMQSGKPVLVIGKTVADTLFKGNPALGRAVSVNSVSFRVVGVLKSKGLSLDGADQDNTVIVPMTSARSYLWATKYYSPPVLNKIIVQIVSSEAMDEATDDIIQLMRQRSNLKESQVNNFSVINLSAIRRVAADTNSTFTMLLAAIASISLLVGSIGIMNIMLVTVTERTREIGIRKAIGATENHILLQFLLEAMMLSFVGSMGGLALGFGAGLAARHWGSVPVEFSLTSVILSVAISAVIGIASGLYPAWKGAKMQPIEALRTIGG